MFSIMLNTAAYEKDLITVTPSEQETVVPEHPEAGPAPTMVAGLHARPIRVSGWLVLIPSLLRMREPAGESLYRDSSQYIV